MIKKRYKEYGRKLKNQTCLKNKKRTRESFKRNRKQKRFYKKRKKKLKNSLGRVYITKTKCEWLKNWTEHNLLEKYSSEKQAKK